MMKTKHRRSRFAASLAALVLSLGLGMAPAHAVIINGGFETGDFSGFTTTGDTRNYNLFGILADVRNPNGSTLNNQKFDVIAPPRDCHS